MKNKNDKISQNQKKQRLLKQPESIPQQDNADAKYQLT